MYCIGIFGLMGIGKIIVICMLCGEVIIDCDVFNFDCYVFVKVIIIVGVDFGEVDLGNGELLQVYGSFGQDCFDFLWDWFIFVIVGVIVMVDVNVFDVGECCILLLCCIVLEFMQLFMLVFVVWLVMFVQVDVFFVWFSQVFGWVILVVMVDV